MFQVSPHLNFSESICRSGVHLKEFVIVRLEVDLEMVATGHICS